MNAVRFFETSVINNLATQRSNQETGNKRTFLFPLPRGLCPVRFKVRNLLSVQTFGNTFWTEVPSIEKHLWPYTTWTVYNPCL